MSSFRPHLKACIRAVSNRLRFPHATIGRSTYLDHRCVLAAGTRIGHHCHLFHAELSGDSILGDTNIIGHGARLVNTTLGAGCIIERDVALFNSALADFVSVQPSATLDRVRVGAYSYFARQAFLNDVTLGAFASIGPQCLLGTGEHPTHLVSTAPVFYSTRRQSGASFTTQDHFTERRPITLGHDVWIGAKVFVRDGVTIGDGAIVAAGAVVTKDIPPYAIAGGVPAKIIRLRFPEAIIARLLALQWWHWPEPRLRAAQPLIAQPDVERFLAWAERSPPP
jgi:chloramphenicol O-acetyltransferase type B